MNTNLTFILLLLCVFSCTNSSPKNEIVVDTESPIKLNRTATIIDDYLEEGTLQGFSGAIMVIENGQPILVKGYGNKTAEGKVKIDKNTLFDMGSITKSFTATAILKLLEEEKLSLNDPIAKFFQNIPNEKKGITIHQLLTHSSGLPGALGYDYDSISENDFLQKTWDSELLFPMGSGYEYSNVGYSILGMIIEKISGESYDDFLQKNIFIPSNMRSTGYSSKGMKIQRVAHGIDKEGKDWGNPKEKNWNSTEPFWHLKANGGLLTSATEMANWFDAIVKNKILKPETLQKQLKGYVDEGGGTLYGYGLVEFEPGKHYGHNGGNGIFRADWHFFPKKNAAVFIVSNSANVSLFEISENILQVLFTGELPKTANLSPIKIDNFPSSSIEKIGAQFFDLLQNPTPKKIESFIEKKFTKGIVERNSKEKMIQIFDQLKKELSGAKIIGASKDENMLSIQTTGGSEDLIINLIFLEEKIDQLSVEAN